MELASIEFPQEENMKVQLIGELKTVMSNRDGIHNYFAWPTLTRLKNGRLAVGASGFRLFHVCPFGKGVLSYSDDGGKTYTSPATVFDTVLDDRDVGLCPFGESGLIATSFNNRVEFQRVQNQKRTDSPKKSYIDAYLDLVSPEAEEAVLGSTYRISLDDGVTFGPILKSPITSPHGPTELQSGEILWVGTSFESGCDILAYRLHSTEGRMEYVGEIDTSGIKGDGGVPGEPYAIETDDGRILCHIRADFPGYRSFTLYQSESFDGGKTWTTPVQILPEGEGAPSHILKHSSGALICAYGHRRSPNGIKVMISRDGGNTWGEGEYLYRHPTTYDLGYPSTVELSDGSLLTVFYTRGNSEGEGMILAQKWSFTE